MTESNALIMNRKYLRARVTKICNATESNFDNLTQIEKKVQEEKLIALKLELDQANRNILQWNIANKITEEIIQGNMEDEDLYDTKLMTCVMKLRNFERNGMLEDNQRSVPHTDRTSLKLPKVPLPTFQNAINENLKKFLRSFESIVNKHNLTSYEKFIYLKNQLAGGPRTLVDSLDVEKQNYETAKQLLEKAFDCKQTAKFETIERLSRLKLPYDQDPYTFIGEMRSIITEFENLEIKTEEVIQYFLWNGLNDRFQNHIISITNKNKPNLKEIEDNIFEATERYIRQNTKYKKNTKNETKNDSASGKTKSDTTSMAVNIEREGSKKGKFCMLCKKDNKPYEHFMSACREYSTPRAKFDKLKALKGCTKCSFINHESKNCTFKFTSRCKGCNGNHMTYLCLKQENTTTRSTTVESENEETHNGVSLVEMANSSSKEPIFLHTLTTELGNKKERKLVRAFKDGGSQRTFIREDLVEKLNFPILEKEVFLRIHGFNTSTKYKTKIAQIQIKIGTKWYEIEAICKDELKTEFRIPNLTEITEKLEEKGYKLADTNLKHCRDGKVSNIGIILGNDCDHILPLNYNRFGDPKIRQESTIIDSPAGVILTGRAETFMKNLEFLEQRRKLKFHEDTASYASASTIPEKEENYDYFTHQTEENVEKMYENTLNIYPEEEQDESETETNKKIVEYVLDNTETDMDGNLIMPLTWNDRNSHLLGKNYYLSLNILKSTLKKLAKEKEKFKMYDEVFKDQEEKNIIEKIDDIERFMIENPQYSFLPHMGVFKMSRETSKCRIVFLSNLCEKIAGRKTVSHLQSIMPGPNLNHKIMTAVMHLRFDEYLLTFDLKQAFLNIKLREEDQNRLMFLWVKEFDGVNFKLIAYRNKRLSFGLTCSPCILMLAIYKILILDEDRSEEVEEIKKAVYNSIYMDNGAYTGNEPEKLEKAFRILHDVFGKYGFQLQQFATNERTLKTKLAEAEGENLEEIKLFGMRWNTSEDKIGPYKLKLDIEANTKKDILSTLNSIYDIYNIYAPFLLKAKLFLQRLSCDKSIKWKTVLNEELSKEWNKIAKKWNSIPTVDIERKIGKRNGQYELYAFTDASRNAIGVIIYAKEVITGKITYFNAKSSLLNDTLRKKSMPSLEFQAITYGAKVLLDCYEALAGKTVVIPIKIKSLFLFTDSLVCMHWLRQQVWSIGKPQNLSVFIRNRLEKIEQACLKFPVTFQHIKGEENPADHLTRDHSYSTILKSGYYEGPSRIHQEDMYIEDDMKVTMPNQEEILVEEIQAEEDTDRDKEENSCQEVKCGLYELVDIKRYSHLPFLIAVVKNVLNFIGTLKRRTHSNLSEEKNYHQLAVNKIIASDQKESFAEISQYFKSENVPKNNIPSLMTKFNLFLDKDQLLRVKSKMEDRTLMPILLSNTSPLTELIIRHTHEELGHSGLYSVLRELRRKYWIPKYYSTVRKILSRCVTCRRFNARTIKINQNSYRDFRTNPPRRPFQSVFMDYIGPFEVKLGERQKVWLLAITCLWSRGLNLKICRSADTTDFLKAVQSHVYEYGIFSNCITDLGSQIQAGASVMKTYLSDMHTVNYFQVNGMKKIEFEHFSKGNSALGSLIETLVKQTKNLIFKTIKNTILDYFDFQFLISRCVSLINKRPIAFKEEIRSLALEEVPHPITPELLIRGFDTCAVNIIPEIQPIEDEEYCPSSGTEGIRKWNSKLVKCKEKLVDVYHGEFLTNLIHQATDKKDRYKPVKHEELKIGDVVLLVEKYTKRYHFPLGRVLEVEKNTLGEVTAAKIRKGISREVVYRHSTSLILLIPNEQNVELLTSDQKSKTEAQNKFAHKDTTTDGVRRSKRQIAKVSKQRIRDFCNYHSK